MIRLLKTNLNRMFKNKIFIVLMISSIIFPYYIDFNEPSKIRFDQAFLYYFLIVGTVIAIFSSFFIGKDYEEGTIRNKIVIGHKRSNIYIANLITTIISVFIFYIMFIIMMLPTLRPLFEKLTKEETRFFILELGSLITSFFVYSSVFTSISMNISSKTSSLIINIILSILLVIVPVKCYAIIEEYAYNQYLLENRPELMEENNNVSLSPTKSDVVKAKIILNITPMGHFNLLTSENEQRRATILFIYSILEFVIFSILGINVFQKKELN